MYQKKQTGLTLLEILIAIAILSIIAAGAAGFLSVSAMLDRSLEEDSIAIYAAQQKMEEILEAFDKDQDTLLDFDNATFSVPESGQPYENMIAQVDGSSAGAVEIANPKIIGGIETRVITIRILWHNINTANDNRQYVLNRMIFLGE
ncbi:prepilin-type N-terminal cleavage/methylation domain-containing protein [Candidatus Uabimicrobium sp. HlEnr_7]|uniref:prepilin-type N-terminal cleavage/methylation domain-containing protein n=1 Tax=Candidatus Uabimicrobium helgolandensis TaxID=3095367 RepID=UPI0035575ECF